MSKPVIIILTVLSFLVVVISGVFAAATGGVNSAWRHLHSGYLYIIPVVSFVVSIVLLIMLDRKNRAEREVELKRQEAEREAERRKQEAEHEAERVGAILAHCDEWGEEICRMLINGGFALDSRIQGIMSRVGEWGHSTCNLLLQKSIGVGMTADMVRASLGEPHTVDNREVTKTSEKYRWIYGVPRHGAVYIWFKDHQVVRIRQ